ncbi:RNA-binding protein 4F [Mortierella antarctica]|nr:RNA-binding protein 4F [Mortierella antarctica]
MDNLSDSDGEDNHMEGVENAASQELLTNIEVLKVSLQTNPSQYEVHLQLIALLKSAAMFEELRAARESMSAVFPLSEELWLQWLNDESNMATSEDEKENVLDLYERATTDYLSIAIWKSYTEYAVQEYFEAAEHGDDGSVLTKDKVTAIFQKANTFTGHHIAQSHIIWNAWAEFETQILDAQESPSEDDIKRIKSMYEQRLVVAHTEIDNTVSSYISFVTGHSGEDFEKAMAECSALAAHAREMLSERESLELELTSTANSLETFLKYLTFELKPKKKRFPYARTLFERALAVHCLVPTLWIDYTTLVLSMESYVKPEEQVNGILEGLELSLGFGNVVVKALADPNLAANPQELSKVVLAHCAYKYRKITKNEDGYNLIRQALEHAVAVIDAAGGDPACNVQRYWIELEAFKFGNPTKARHLWSDVIVKQKTMADSWIAMAEMDKRLTNVKEARHTYKRACDQAKHLDWPEKLFDSWITFERENSGDFEYREALIRTREAMKSVEALRAQYGQTYAEVVPVAAEIAPVVPVTAEIAPVAPEPEASETNNKRKSSTEESDQTFKVPKVEEKEAESPELQPHPPKNDFTKGRRDDSCFFSNFPQSTTDEDLKKMFSEYGKVIRLNVPVRMGRRQGFGYVQYPTAEEAQAAVDGLNGRDVGERRGLVVKISDTTKAARHYTDPPLPHESRHELRLSGISDDIQEADIMKLMSLYGTPASVYIHRGSDEIKEPWANIKFDVEDEARAALALNGTEYYGKTLSVKRRSFVRLETEKGVGRRERRRFAARQGARAQGSWSTSSEGSSAVPTEAPAVDEPKAEKKIEGEETQEVKSGKEPSEVAPKAPSSLTSMTPRSMAPRVLGKVMPRTGYKGFKAFKPASTAAAGATSSIGSQSSSSSGSVGEASKEAEGGEGESSSVPKPRSNSDFRAMLLSGQLKRQNQ